MTTMLATLSGLWQRNRDLLHNAGSLAMSTGLTSLFGVVYWIVAAREFSSQSVGYASASISAMTLVGTIGMFGLGTVLIGELPKRAAKGGLMSAAIIAAALGTLLIGVIFPIGTLLFHAKFPEISGTPIRVVVFALGSALTAATLVFDDGAIGLMRGGLQLNRNLAMSVAKLAALPLLALFVHDMFGVGIVMTWVLGTAVSVIPVVITIKRGGYRVLHRPDWGLLRRLGKVAMAHNWLNLAIATPPKLIPVLVTVVVSPSANAAFYIAWLISGLLVMVPAHLSTVLFAIASAAPELFAEKLRFVLRTSLLIGLPAMVIIALLAPFLLGIFGHEYAALGTVPLWLLLIGYIPRLPKAQYIAVSRATGRVPQAATLLTVCMVAEMVGVVVGGKLGGLNGVSIGYLAVVCVEGALTTPTVLRAASAREQARRAATGGFAAVPADGSTPAAVPVSATGPFVGLAAVVALAGTAAGESHTLDVATEVWRTGSFPAVPNVAGGASGRHRRPGAEITSVDLFGGADARMSKRASYRSRQLAGVDALIALATSVSAEPAATERSVATGRVADEWAADAR